MNILGLKIRTVAVFALTFASTTSGFGIPRNHSIAPFGEGTIWTVSQEGDLDKVKKLIYKTPGLANARFIVHRGTPDQVDWTPLALAAVAGKVEVVKFLLSRGASVDMKRSNGNTPLFDVIIWGSDRPLRPTQTLSVLVAHKANVNVRTKFGFIPLGYVRTVDVAKFLLDHGALLNGHANFYGITPLESIVKYRVPEASKTGHFPEVMGVVRLLVRRGANLNIKDKTGKTALNYARALQNPEQRSEAVNFFLKNGAQ